MPHAYLHTKCWCQTSISKQRKRIANTFWFFTATFQEQFQKQVLVANFSNPKKEEKYCKHFPILWFQEYGGSDRKQHHLSRTWLQTMYLKYLQIPDISLSQLLPEIEEVMNQETVNENLENSTIETQLEPVLTRTNPPYQQPLMNRIITTSM